MQELISFHEIDPAHGEVIEYLYTFSPTYQSLLFYHLAYDKNKLYLPFFESRGYFSEMAFKYFGAFLPKDYGCSIKYNLDPVKYKFLFACGYIDMEKKVSELSI